MALAVSIGMQRKPIIARPLKTEQSGECWLDGIGADLNAAVVEEARQPIPMVEAISDGLGDG